MTFPDALPPSPSAPEDARPEPGGNTPQKDEVGSAQQNGSRAEGAIPLPPDDEEIARLRTLLFAREIALLDDIRASLDNPRQTMLKVSDVLAEAVQLRSDKDPALSMALSPLVDGIVKTSLHSRRNDFVNALFPLMGPTIRKAIGESFRSMLGNFSKSMEMAFSWKGLRWRIEALRSGKPFSEIVMLNTLVYRVEQLFFIHSDTGLVLSHLAGDSVDTQDAEMVSAMLTAIQDFARDCFAGGKDADLDSLQMGEFTICIEKGRRAYLACVVRGMPPTDFRSRLRATLDLMLVEYSDALDDFSGDTEPFSGAPRYLETCLLSRFADEDKALPLWAKALPVAVLLALLAGGGYLYHEKSLARERQAAAAEKQARLAAEQKAFTESMRASVGLLRSEPGLLVANVAEAPEAPWEILVLKDSLARKPEEVLKEKGIDPGLFTVRAVPFMSYDPSIVVRRVKKSIQPPDTVNMVFDERGALVFTGTAPMSWIVATREDARAIPGVEHVDVSGVRDPMTERISAMIREVEGAVIEFPLGKDTPLPATLPALNNAIDTLVALEQITKSMGFSATLTIYGHADAVGNAQRNYEISQARAKTVAALLYARGSSMPVAIYGMGADYPLEGAGEEKRPSAKGGEQVNRRIELRVHFSLSPSARPEMFRR